MIIKSEVDDLFLYVWLKVHRLKVENLDLRSKKNRVHVVYEIGNDNIRASLKSDFDQFKKSDKCIEDYFNVDLLVFKQNGKGTYAAKAQKVLDRRVIILFKSKKGKYDFEDHPKFSKAPIEMTLESILSIYDISDKINILPLMEFNALELENRHQVCIDLYRKVGNMCQLHYDFPGFRQPTWTPKHRIKIAIDQMEIPYLPKFYWIPCDQLISTEYFCTKMPRKCGYSTFQLSHLKEHEEVCSDQTKIISRQV